MAVFAIRHSVHPRNTAPTRWGISPLAALPFAAVLPKAYSDLAERHGAAVQAQGRARAEPREGTGPSRPVTIAVLSTRPRRLSDYFTQLFAQVTNPPLDAIREGLVTSMADTIGPEGNLLDPEPGSCRLVVLETPVLVTSELAKLRYINEHGETPGFRAFALDGLVDVSDAPSPDLAGARLAGAIAACCDQVDRAIADGANLVILSDRNA